MFGCIGQGWYRTVPSAQQPPLDMVGIGLMSEQDIVLEEDHGHCNAVSCTTEPGDCLEPIWVESIWRLEVDAIFKDQVWKLRVSMRGLGWSSISLQEISHDRAWFPQPIRDFRAMGEITNIVDLLCSLGNRLALSWCGCLR